MEHRFLLLLLIVVSVKAGPLTVRKSTCMQTCPTAPDTSKFSFETGKRYSFDYVSDTWTKLSNEPKQTTGLRIKSKAHFEMVSSCEMVLHLENVFLEELLPSDGRTYIRSPNTQRFARAVETNDLHFAFIDGEVRHICAHKAEPNWVLNVKRGVISMIQNTMPSLSKAHSGDELDVTGNCKVRYSSSIGENSSILVKREKDLLTCTDRQSHRSSIQSMPYFVRSDTQSVPFTMSTHSCQQTIKNGRFDKIECAEMHRLRSFSRSPSARTKVSQTLTFIEESASTGKSHLHPEHRRTRLTFDFEKKQESSGQEMRQILAVLTDVCARYRKDIRPHSPRLFTELVYQLRRLNARDLRKVYAIVDRKKACRRNNAFVRRLFLDAIPMLGNAHSMAIMKDMIIGKKVSALEANLWLTSLAFVQKPNAEMLAYLRPLLDEKTPRKQAMLGLSAMVHQYCRNRPNCHTEREVQTIGRALRRFLHGDCSSSTPEQQTQVLIAIKAIGNAGVLSFISNDLVRCARREENSMAVRVAAVEAFRRMSCSVDRKPLMEMYRDIKIDAELRINAYLTVMRCPTEETIEAVKNQLAAEKVNQVGSFVWTHLTNLAETADPMEKNIKDILEDVSLKKEFKLDKLKFSRNIEKSIFLKSANTGGRMDSNLIWSPKSFIPRSVSLNLTSYLFGQSYNFFEVNGRVEGLETLLERFFGPEGVFKPSKDPKAMKQAAVNAKDFQFMDNKFKMQNDRLRGSMAFKIFGQEVGFFELFGNSKSAEGINFLDVLIKLANHQEMEWSKNFMFLDTTVIIPTITGLPLELSVNGTASLALKAKGKMDIRRMVSWPTTFDIDGSLQPSGSVEISAMMGVDAFYSRYGMKMVSNVHSSTQLDGKLKAKNSETFDVEFKTPREKQEIVNFNTKFFMVNRNEEFETTSPGRRFERTICTGRTLTHLTGAELCATVQAPTVRSLRETLLAPISSPFAASVALHMRDTQSGYRFSAKWLTKKHHTKTGNAYSRTMRFEIDTPGSRIPRRHLINFELDIPKRAIRFHLDCPKRRFGFTGAFTNQPDHKSLQLKFYRGLNSYFNVKFDSKVERNGQAVIFSPTIKVIVPGVPSISLTSRFLRSPNAYSFETVLKNLLKAPMVLKGGVEHLRPTKNTIIMKSNLYLNSHFFRGGIFGQIDRTPGKALAAIIRTTRGRQGPIPQESAFFLATVRRVRSGDSDIFKVNLEHQISRFPGCKSKALLTLKRNKSSVDIKTDVRFGRKLEENIHSVVKIQVQSNENNGIDIFTTGTVVYPRKNIDASGKMTFVTGRGAGAIDLLIKRRPDEETLNLAYKVKLMPTDNLRVKSNMTVLLLDRKYKIKWNTDLQKDSEGTYRLFTDGDFNGRNAYAESSYKSSHLLQHSLASIVKIGSTDVIKMNVNSNFETSNPLVEMVVKRNEKTYAISGKYLMKKSEKEYSLDYQTELEYPERKVRLSGAIEREDINVKSKFACAWDADRDDTKVMILEAGFQRELKNGKKTTELELSVRHPARNGHFQVTMEREDYKGSVHMELEYAPEKQFVIDSMFEIDDGWTQKGLLASITVKTPFERFESTHLGINLFGQLRYRKAEITFLYDKNKRIVTNLVIRPQGGTNFVATLKIITPFPRYSFMKFHLKNVVTGTQIQSELISEFGTKKTLVQVVGVNNGDYYANDLALAVSMISPFKNFRDLTLTLDYKDDSNQYSSNLEFKWAKDKKVTAKTNFNFLRNGMDITSTGDLRFTSPVKDFEKGGLSWQHQSTKSMIKSEVSIEYKPNEKATATFSGILTRPEAGALRIVGRTGVSVPGNQIGAKFSHHHTKNSVNIQTEIELPGSQNYDLEVSGKRTPSRVDGFINLDTPHDGYRKIGASFDLNNGARMKIFESEIYAGNTKAALSSLRGKLTLPSKSDPNIVFNGKFKSNIVRYVEVVATHQHSIVKRRLTSLSELKLMGKTITVSNELSFDKAKKLKSSISTSFEGLRSLIVGFEHEGTASKFSHMHFVTYNSNFEFQTRASYEGLTNIVAESKLNFRGLHSLRFSNQKNGKAYETSAVATVKTTKTIEYFSRVLFDPKLSMEMKLTTPFDVIRSVKASLEAKMSGLKTSKAPKTAEVVATATYNYGDKVITTNAVMNMNSLDDVRATISMNTPFDNVRDLSLVVSHNKRGKEYTTSIVGKTENGRAEVSNIFQKQGTLKNKLTVKTPFKEFQSLTLDFEHRGSFPKLSHKHRISFDVAGVNAKLTNKFDIFNLRLIEIETKFRSNMKNAEKAGFRFTFDKPIGGIETGVLVEWPSDKLEGRVAFKSNPEKKLQLKISTPFYYFKELEGLYTLGNKSPKNFNHQIILSFKNDVLTVGVENAVTVQSLGYVDVQLKINTPYKSFETFSASYHHEMLKRTKRVEVNGEYNTKKYLLKGSYSDSPVHTIEATLQTPHKNFKTITTRHEMAFDDAFNWKLSGEYFNAELNDRVVSSIESKKEAKKMSGNYKLNRNGKIMTDARYQLSWEDKKRYALTVNFMNDLLPKNPKSGQMILLEASADIRKAISIRASLRTPFKKFENQWISIKFERNEFLKADTMKTGTLIVEANALGKVTMLRFSYSYGKRPSFSINLKLPNRKEMKMEGSLVMSDTNSFFKLSATLPDNVPKPWSITADVTTTKTTGVVVKVETSVKNYELITARATITKHDKYFKVSGRLSMPVIKKPIEFDAEYDRSTGLRLALSMRGPIVRYFRSSLDFSGDIKKFDLKAEVFTVHLKAPLLSLLSFDSTDGFKVEGTMKSPLTYLQNIGFEAAIVKSDKRGYVEVTHENLASPIRAEGKIDYAQTKFEGIVTLKTPFKKAEMTEVKLSFVKSGYMVQTKFDLSNSALKGPFSGNMHFNYAKPRMELSTKLMTPFEAMKETTFSLVLLLQRDVNGKIILTHNKLSDRIVGRIDVQFPNKLELEVSTPFNGWYKHVIVTTVFNKGSPFTLGTVVKYYPANVISLKLQGEMNLPKISFDYNIATPFEVLRQSYGSVDIKAEKNFKLEATVFHNKLKEKITLSIRADDADTKTLVVQFNSPLDGPMKDVGIKLFIARKPDAFGFLKAWTMPKSFSVGARINYHQGKQMSVVASVNAPSWKKFDAKIKFISPFEIMKKLDATMEFDIEENILLAAKINHNKMTSPIETRLFVDKKSMKLFYTLSTPFDGPHKSISVEGFVKKVGELHSYEINIEYFSGQKIILNGETRFKKTDFFITFNLKTPFEKMKDMNGRLTFNPKKEPMITYEVMHPKMGGKIEGTIHVAGLSRLKMTLKSPLDEPWKDILLDYSYKKVSNAKVASLLLKYSPDKEYKAIVSHKMEGKTIDSSLSVETPHEIMKKMSAELKGNWKDNVVVNAELNHNKLKESIHVELSYEMKDAMLLQVTMTTPFEKVKSLSLKMSYSKKDDVHKSSITIVYNKVKTYEFHGYLKNKKDDKEITLGMQTPHSGIWKAMTFNGAYTKKAQSYNVHMKFIYNGAKTIEFNGVTNTDPKDLKLELSLQTPFKKMEETEMKFTFKTLNARRFRAATNMKFESSLSFSNSKLFNGKPIVANTKGTMKPEEKSLEGDVQFKDKKYTAEVYYKKNGNKYSVGASTVTDEPSRPWFAKAEATVNSATDFSIDAKVTCPTHRLEKAKAGVLNIKLNHKGNFKSFENAMEVTSPYHAPLKYNGKVTSGPVAEFLIEGPLMKVTKITLKHSGSYEKFVSSSEIKFNDATAITFDAEGGFSKKLVTFKSSLKTPFKKWEDNSLSLESSTNMLKQSSAFSKAKLLFKSSSLGELEISSETKKDPTSYVAAHYIRNNLKQLVTKEQTHKSTLKVTGLKKEETAATFELESSSLSEKVEVAVEWKKTSDTFTAKGKINAIKNYLKNEFTLDITKMKLKESSAALTIKSKSLKESVEMKVSWKKTDTSFEASVESKAPVKYMNSKITVSIPKMTPKESDATLTVTSTDLKEPVETKVSWKKTDTSFEASVESKAPVKYMKSKITVSIPKMTPMESDATLTVTSTDLKEPVETKVSWKKTDTSFEGSVESKAPVKFTKSKITVSIPKMTPKESDVTLKITSTDLKEPVETKVSWKKTDTSFEASVESKAPVKFMKSKITVSIPKMTPKESDATLTVTSTDLKEPASIIVNWKKDDKSFTGKIATASQFDKSEITINANPMSQKDSSSEVTLKSSNLKGPISLKVVHKLDKKKTLTIALRTPYKPVKEVDIEIETSKVKSQNYFLSTKLSSNALGSVTSKIDINIGGKKELDIVIMSGTSGRRIRRAAPSKIFSLNAKSMKNEHSITVETPKSTKVKKISLKVTNTDKQIRAELTWDANKVTVEANRPKKYTLSVDVTSTFKGYEKMRAEVSGSETCCENGKYTAEVSIPKGKSSFSLIWKKTAAELGVQGTFKNSLIPKVPDMSLVIVHKGVAKKFETAVDFTYGKKEINAKTSFDMVDKKSLTAELKTPFKRFEETSVNAVFTGDKNKFTVIGSTKSSLGEASFEINSANEKKPTDRQTGSFVATFNKKSYTAKYFFEGDKKSFRSGLEVRPGTARVRRATTEAYVNIELTSKLQLTTYEGLAKVESRFLPDGYKTMTIDTKAEGDLKTFKKFDVTTTGKTTKEVFMAKLRWDMASAKAAGLEMKFPSLKKGCVVSTQNFFYFGSELKASSKIEHCSKQLLDFSLTSDKKSKASASLKTPYKPINTKIDYEHKKAKKSISATLTFDNERLGKYSAEIKASWASGVTAEVQVTTPKYKNMAIKIRQQGSAKKSEATVEITLPDSKTINAKLTYDVNMPISIEATLETPYDKLKMTKIVFNHAKEPKKFKTSLEFENNKLGKYSTSLSFDSSRSAFVTFILKTPHPQVKDLEIEFSYTGKIDDKFSQGLSGTLNGKKLGYMANINVKNLLYRIVINTPFKGFEVIVISNEHKGDSKNFEHAIMVEYGNSKKIRMELSHDMKSAAYNGNLRFTSHFDKLKDVSLVVKGTKTGPKTWTKEITLKYAPSKLIRSRGELNWELPQLKGKLEVETPFEKLKTMEINMEHTHNANSDFKFKHVLTVNGKSGSFHGSLKRVNKRMIAFAELTTPFAKLNHIDLNILHNGDLRKFENDATLAWQPGTNQIRATTKLDISKPQTISGTFVLNTPWNVLRTGRIELRHEGGLKKHTQSVQFEHNGRRIEYQGMVNLLDLKDMSIEHSIRTPFQKLKSFKVSLDHQKGVAHLNIFYNKMNAIKIVGLLNLDKMVLAELSVSTALYNRPSGAIRVKNFYDGGESITQGTVDFNGLKSNVEFGYNRNRPEVRVVASLPHSASYEFRVAIHKIANSFEGRIRVAKDKNELLVGETKVKYDMASKKKTLDFKMTGFVVANDKKDVKIELTFDGDLKASNTILKINALSKHDIQVVASYKFYEQALVSIKYNNQPYSIAYIYGPSADMKNGQNLAIKMQVGKNAGGLSIDIGPNELEFDLKTPFAEVKELFATVYHKQKNSINFEHRSQLRLNNHRYFNLDLSVDTASGVIRMKAPQSITIKYSVAGTRFVRAVLDLDLSKTDRTKKTNIELFMQMSGDLSSIKYNVEGFLHIKSKARLFVIETKTTVSPSSFFHKTKVSPRGANVSPWELNLSTLRHIAGHDRERTDEWILTTPVRQMKIFMESSLSKTLIKNDLDFFWDNKRVPSKKLGWKLKMMNKNNEYRSVMLFHHPIMKEGVQLETQTFLMESNTLIRSKAIFKYTDNPRDTLVVSLKISQEGDKLFRGTMSVSQESTQLYTKLAGSFGGNRGIYANSLSFEHKCDGKIKTFQVSTHLNVLKKSFMMEVVTPVRTLSLMSVGTITSSSASVNYQLSVDKNKKVSGDMTFSTSPSFKVRVFYNPGNPDNYIEAYGKFVTQKHLEFQVHRMVDNRRNSDFLFSLKLKGEHLLKSRLFWRPTALVEAQTYVMKRIDELKKSGDEFFPKFAEAVKNEVAMKKNLLIATIPDFDNIRKYSQTELDLIKEDLFKLGGIVYDMYMSNEFYLRNVINYLVRMALAAREKSRAAAVSFQEYYVVSLTPLMHNIMNRPAGRMYVKFIKDFLDMTRALSQRAQQQANIASSVGQKCIHSTIEKIGPFVATLDKKYTELERRSIAAAKNTMTAIRYHYVSRVHPHVVRTHQMVKESLNAAVMYYRSSKTSLLDHVNEDLRSVLQTLNARIQRKIDLLAHKYSIMFKALREQMDRQISQQNFDRFSIASDFVKSGISNIQWAYNHFDLENKMKDFAHSQYLHVLDYLRENSVEVIKQYLKLEQNMITVYQPSRGRIEGQFYMPFPMRDLRSRPDHTEFRKPMRKIYRALRKNLPGRGAKFSMLPDFKTTLLRYIPTYETNPRAWLPATRGYASIAGNHIITFDKVHFDLDGNCNYVLARDYNAKRWTVLLNEAGGKRSISFRVYNKVFGINKDHSVTVDGEKVELPYMFRNLTIHRFGPIIKAKDSFLGFSVTSDVVNDVHTLGVTKWYHGKLGGLFGNFDDEQYNDMQTVDHQLTSDVNKFIQSWTIGNCRHVNKVKAAKESGPIGTKICEFFFKCPYSPMAKCFRHISVTPFLTMCLKDVNADSKTGMPKACHSAQLYAMQCKKAHISVKKPLICRKCKTPDKTYIKEDATTIIHNDKPTADVVFVVEEAPCNRDLMPKLNEVVQRLELAFGRRGMTDIRYGLVGFGRKVHGTRCPRAHSHTIDSQLMGKASSFARALRNFDLDARAEQNKRSDALQAIMKASRYPLRPGAAKHIVVVPCAACEERRTNLEDAEEALKDQDIMLHVLIEHDIRIRRPDLHPQSNYLFGVDKRFVYTEKDVKKLSGNQQLFRRVMRPLDVCSQLAYSTNGAVFNSGKLTRMHVTSQTWFSEVFAQRLAAVSHSPAKAECTCVAGYWRPHLMCKRSGSATVPMMPQPVLMPSIVMPPAPTQAKLDFRR